MEGAGDGAAFTGGGFANGAAFTGRGSGNMPTCILTYKKIEFRLVEIVDLEIYVCLCVKMYQVLYAVNQKLKSSYLQKRPPTSFFYPKLAF